MKRVCVLGISGSGKTIFATRLAQFTKLPLFHMDQLFWAENWQEIPAETWSKEEKEILKREEWIIEGYIDERYPDRLKYADFIFYLDYPGYLAAWNLLKRYWKYKNKNRPELPKGCHANFDVKFIWAVLMRHERHDIERILKNCSDDKIITFKHPKDLQSWIDKNLRASASICG